MAESTPVVNDNARRPIAALLVSASVLIALYWLAWLVHRSLVASDTSVPYVQFENAFPMADGWLVVCLLAGAFSLVTHRRAAVLWLIAAGAAGLYLFAMDVLYDLQHGVWGRNGNGVVELVINIATLALSLFVLRWTWRRRDELLRP